VGKSMTASNYLTTLCNRARVYSCRHNSATSGFSPCAACRSKKRSFVFSSFAFFLAVALVLPAAAQTPSQSTAKPLDKKTVLEKALRSYYILENQGLKSFQCTVQPDWKKFIAAMQKPGAGEDPRLALLLPVQYSVAVDDQGDPKITPILTTGGTLDASVEGVVAGAQRTILGFFESWDSMVLSSLFSPSEEDGYTLVEQPDGYKLTEVSGELNIEILLTKEFLFTTMKSTAPGVVILVKPQFTKTDKGLLMTSMDDDINNGSQKVTVQIQYQEVEGLQLPSKVSYIATFSGQTVPLELAFTKYQLAKR
jgi:hypothetical protein